VSGKASRSLHARFLPTRFPEDPFFVDVYADNDNYYFFDTTPTLLSFTPRSVERVKECSFVVDGRTRKLVRSPERNWSGSPYVRVE